MAKNLEELRKEYPELAATIEAEIKAAMGQRATDAIVAAESKRLQEIDEIAPAVNNDAMVYEAKYGETACSAKDLAYRVLKLRADVDAGVKAAKQAYTHTNS